MADNIRIISNPEFNGVPFQINGRTLWDFYIKSEFIYPEKLNMLNHFKQEILETFNKMLICEDNTFKFFFAIINDLIIGSIVASQLTDHSWVIQHLSVLPEYRLTNAAKSLLLAINSWMINNQEMHYFQNYFRQKTKIAYKTFQGMLRGAQGSDFMTLESKNYLVLDYQAASSLLKAEIPEVDIHEIQPEERIPLSELMSRKYKKISLAVTGFLEQGISIEGTKKKYEDLGLFRKRNVLIANSEKQIVGTAIVDTTSIGVNLSHIFDAAHIYIFDERIQNKIIAAFTKNIYNLQKEFGKSKVIVLTDSENNTGYSDFGYQMKRTYLQYNLSREGKMFDHMYNMIKEGKRLAS